MILPALRPALQPDPRRAVGAAMRSAFAPTALPNLVAWYDNRDFSALFQDSAGTTPVTAAGQSVGLQLDKSRGLARGAELWNDAAVVFSSEAVRISPNVYRIRSLAGEHAAVVVPSILTVDKTYEVTFTIDSITVLGAGLTVESVQNATFTTVGTHTCRVKASGVSASIKRASTACDIQVSGISIREVPGNHRHQPTAINRPVLQQDSNGFYYLAYNGSSQWLVTPTNVDMSGTNKVTCFAGIHKLSDASASVFAAFGDTATNNGSFALYPRNTGTAAGALFRSRGTTLASAVVSAGLTAPLSMVMTGHADISLDLCTLRVNGAQVASDAADQGTGNFGAYPMYFGALAGASLFFNGREYQTIIVGNAVDVATAARCERWVGAVGMGTPL